MKGELYLDQHAWLNIVDPEERLVQDGLPHGDDGQPIKEVEAQDAASDLLPNAGWTVPLLLVITAMGMLYMLDNTNSW